MPVHRSTPDGVKNCWSLVILVIMFFFFFCTCVIFSTRDRVSFVVAQMMDCSHFDKGIEIASKVFGFAILWLTLLSIVASQFESKNFDRSLTLFRYTQFYFLTINKIILIIIIITERQLTSRSKENIYNKSSSFF